MVFIYLSGNSQFLKLSECDNFQLILLGFLYKITHPFQNFYFPH